MCFKAGEDAIPEGYFPPGGQDSVPRSSPASSTKLWLVPTHGTGGASASLPLNEAHEVCNDGLRFKGQDVGWPCHPLDLLEKARRGSVQHIWHAFQCPV